MKKIKLLSFIFFIFSVLAFSYPATKVFAQSTETPDRQVNAVAERGGRTSFDDAIQRATYRYLQTFFVDRRIDRHTNVVLEAFNGCTGQSLSRQSIRQALFPSSGPSSEDTLTEFIRNIPNYEHLIPLKPCLCESNIDHRILRRGIRCDPTSQVSDMMINTILPPAATTERDYSGPRLTTVNEEAERGGRTSFDDAIQRATYRYLQTFFVDRSSDRHTPIFLEAFNSCTGINFTTQSIRRALTPSPVCLGGPTPTCTSEDLIESFRQHIQPHTQNLKACLCESDIDARILIRGVKCDPRAFIGGGYDRDNVNNEQAITYLQTFFVDRRQDRHTHIVREALNSCTEGFNFTTQSIRRALTPPPGTTIDNTIESFMHNLQPHTQTLKACLCESDIDPRILVKGLRCDPFQNANKKMTEIMELLATTAERFSDHAQDIIRNMQ